MTRFGIALALAALLATIALAPAGAADSSISVTMNAQNNSGESGTATLTAVGDQTKVVLDLSGAPAGPQPAHIHEGTCANLNPTPKYPLTSVVNGKSETTVNVSLASLLTGGFAINVHKSPQEVSTYFSCGTIPAAGQVSPTTGRGQAGSAFVAGGIALLAALTLGGGLVLRRRPAR